MGQPNCRLKNNARNRVRVNGTFSDDFLVQGGLHQGSVLSSLLFFIVLEAITRENSLGSHEELLYLDNLALVKDTLEDLKERRKLEKAH